jgi:hypothetical protein
MCKLEQNHHNNLKDMSGHEDGPVTTPNTSDKLGRACNVLLVLAVAGGIENPENANVHSLRGQ